MTGKPTARKALLERPDASKENSGNERATRSRSGTRREKVDETASAAPDSTLPTGIELTPEELYDSVMKVKIVAAKYDYKSKSEQLAKLMTGLKKSLTHFHSENAVSLEIIGQKDRNIELLNKEKQGLQMDVSDLRTKLQDMTNSKEAMQKEKDELKQQMDGIAQEKADKETALQNESKAKFEVEFKLKRENSKVCKRPVINIL